MRQGTHPNSLKNLRPMLTTESARAAQLKSAASRKANNEAREALKLTTQDFKEFKRTVLDDLEMTAIDVLKHQMIKAMTEGEDDKAIEIAKSLAEFETPKLARIDQTNTEISTSDLSDEELQEKLKELLGDS